MYTAAEKTSAAARTIEITVISAEGLTMANSRQAVKKNSFVVLKTDPLNSRSTGLDRVGGSNPAWNEKLVMDLPSHARFVTVEVHLGPKIIGSANVLVSDFAGGFLPENYLSLLSYRLRDVNGEKNGIINLSVKVRGTTTLGNTSCAAGCSRPWMGVPADSRPSGGIVMGVPVRP